MVADKSLLIGLEPILGVAIALNLAYLNLAKFAYITNVKASVNKRLQALDPNVVTLVGSTTWYKQLKALSNVETIDSAKRFNSGVWVPSPGLWGALFNVLFYWRLGRVASLAFTAFSIISLILAVGYEVGTLSVGMGTSVSGKMGLEFWTATVALIWPIFVAASGEYVLLQASRFISYQTTSMRERAVEEANASIDATATAISSVTNS